MVMWCRTVSPFLLFLAFLFSVLGVSPVLAQNQSHRDLQRSLLEMVQSFERNHGATVGVSTLVMRTGKVPFTYRGTQPMVPASNLKVVTTAVALDRLGPNYRFETRLYGPAQHSGGVATGNLVLKGSGDPCFFPPFTSTSMEPFENFVRALRTGGVHTVTGSLIVDDSDFDREFLDSGYHERYLLDSYAAPVGGLSLNHNVVRLKVTTDSVQTQPSVGSMEFINQLGSGGGGAWVERPRGTDRVLLKGSLAPGQVFETTLTVGDPVRFAGSAFFRAMQRGGVSVKGGWKTVPEGQPAPLGGLVLMAKHASPPLSTIAREINVESDNILAQHVFRRLGASIIGYGTVRNSESVVREFFRRHRIDDRGLRMTDGSGLSERNRIAPHQLVRVLQAMWGHGQGQLFIDSLPAPSEGTLQYRLAGSTLRAKTGTLNNHSGLTGYVVTSYGQTVGFSILVNDIGQAWHGVELQDRIVGLIARWDRPL